MQNIADELGVSKVTVSKALNHKEGVGEALKEKILETADRMGYVLPDYGARKARTVGIIMGEGFHASDANRFYTEMCAAIREQLQARSYSGVMLTPNGASLEQDAQTLEKPGVFHGLILVGVLDARVRERMDRIELPKVYVDVYDESGRSDSVVTENFYSSYEITKYLIRMGHREIGFTGTIGATTSISDRYLGYLRACMEQGIPYRPEWIIGDRDAKGEIMEPELPELLPTAFVCNCDESAFRMTKALKARGLTVPADVSLVGFNNDMYSGLCEPELTTVAVDMEAIGRRAAECISSRMEGRKEEPGEVYPIPGKIVFRNSVRELKTI